MTNGRFITLEGGEGVGKSTQTERVSRALGDLGKSVVTTREPGGTPGAEAIRALLMTGESNRWSARAEAMLFAAARADHVERVIRPALDRGDWVICDRFIDSTRAYQSGEGGLSDAEIMDLHRLGCGGLMPDRTLLLAMAPETGSGRAFLRDGAEADRFARRGDAFDRRVAASFLRMASNSPERIRIVDASGEPDAVTRAVLSELGDLL